MKNRDTIFSRKPASMWIGFSVSGPCCVSTGDVHGPEQGETRELGRQPANRGIFSTPNDTSL
jgi:hypothetical protein